MSQQYLNEIKLKLVSQPNKISHVELLINGRLKTLALYPSSSQLQLSFHLHALVERRRLSIYFIFCKLEDSLFIHVSLSFHLCFGCVCILSKFNYSYFYFCQGAINFLVMFSLLLFNPCLVFVSSELWINLSFISLCTCFQLSWIINQDWLIFERICCILFLPLQKSVLFVQLNTDCSSDKKKKKKVKYRLLLLMLLEVVHES